ncbi:MAG: hypothetical protein IT580_06675 [Verrucomicrobiales bacterium]|nr:hypothetical protein [Verrucomicrobiales bacterium]
MSIRLRFHLTALLLLLAGGPRASAATLSLDFGLWKAGAVPEDFAPALMGGGPAPEWRVIQVDAESQLAPLPGTTTPSLTTETVLAQLSQDPTDERFPLLIYRKEIFADFKATLTFRTVAGRVERMAGLAFRVQDPTNYYVIRASSGGNTFRFYKVVDGVRGEPIGPSLPIPTGTWHTLSVECKGNAISFLFNGRAVIPPLNDSTFLQGHLALWTKSDSVSHFRSLVVEYDEVRTLPRLLVDRGMARFPRLLGITVFGRIDGQAKAIASSDPALVGTPADPAETEVLDSGKPAAKAASSASTAVFPLSDRNGEPLFAVRLKMRTFTGQTANNAAARAQPIAEYLQSLVQTSEGRSVSTN